MQVTVSVTSDDIATGKRAHNSACPLAKAINRAFHKLYLDCQLPEAYAVERAYVSVGLCLYSVSVFPAGYTVGGLCYKAEHTPQTLDFVKAFDGGGVVYPEDFQLDFQLAGEMKRG